MDVISSVPMCVLVMLYRWDVRWRRSISNEEQSCSKHLLTVHNIRHHRQQQQLTNELASRVLRLHTCIVRTVLNIPIKTLWWQWLGNPLSVKQSLHSLSYYFQQQTVLLSTYFLSDMNWDVIGKLGDVSLTNVSC